MSPSQDPGARPVSAAETDTRSSKRRKTSHPRPRSQPRAHGRLRPNEGRRTSKDKRPRPHPPRDVRRLTARPKPDSGLSTPQGTSNEDPKFTLSFAKSVLDKIWVRNKNQHRTQPWWKSLSMLRKAVSRLVLVEQEERSLRGQMGQGAMDAKAVRERFERETQIRRDKEIWIDWTRQVLVPRAYLVFTGLVSDTQFAHLGLVLVGILADVVSTVGLPTPSQQGEAEQGGTEITATRKGQSDSATAAAARSLTAKSTRVTGLQSGEVVERTYDSDDLGEVVERKRKGPKEEQELSQTITPRTRPDRGTDQSPTLGGREEEAAAAGPATDGVSEKGRTVRTTKAGKQENSSSASPSTTSLTTSQRDLTTATTPPSQDSGITPPRPPPHPPAPPPGSDSTGTPTIPQERQKQTTSNVEAAAAKETKNNSKSTRGNTKGKVKEVKGKGKRKNAIDDLFAGLT